MASYVYALTRPPATSIDEFAAALLGDVGGALKAELPGVNWLLVTLRDPDARSVFADASVEHGGETLSVEAIVEITLAATHPLLGGVHEQLRSCAGTVQGWRTTPVVSYGEIGPVVIGERSPWTRTCIFLGRADGMTQEDFAEQWGRRHMRRRWEVEHDTLLQIEAYLLDEAVTPTSWLVHGYEPIVYPENAAADEAGAQDDPARAEQMRVVMDAVAEAMRQGADHEEAVAKVLAEAGLEDLLAGRGLQAPVVYSVDAMRSMSGRDYFLVANSDRIGQAG
jgi:hypothetical protein